MSYIYILPFLGLEHVTCHSLVWFDLKIQIFDSTLFSTKMSVEDYVRCMHPQGIECLGVLFKVSQNKLS